MHVELDPVEQRVIGCLLEKERTVPDSYPMTLNGLRTACNQTSGRDPVLQLDEGEVTRALDRLRAAGLTRVIHASHGARVPKYRQVLDEVLALGDGERAVLTVLLLRGPQTPGELRSRSDRLYAFTELREVDAALASLGTRDEPLVRELERRPGQKETRWVHLLGPVDLTEPAPTPSLSTSRATTSAPTEAVLADGAAARDAAVVEGYSTAATAYADELLDELDRKPFDRWLLERLVELSHGGPAADVGCGPGHVTAHLALAGADAHGFDLAPGMVDEARRRFPELPFALGDLRALPPPSEDGRGWSLVTAWYALVHLAASEMDSAVANLAAALRPGGWLGIALHEGAEVRHVDALCGVATQLSFTFHQRSAVVAAFAAAGLVDVEWYVRSPSLPETTDRLYVVGRRAG